MKVYVAASIIVLLAWAAAAAFEQPLPPGRKWITSWAASVHGPYPAGNPVAQPALDRAFESPASGASNQTLRLIVRPSLWGSRARLRFANTFGSQPVTLDDVFVGLQSAGGNIASGTNQRVTFNGRPALTLSAGRSGWSDPVSLPAAAAPLLEERKLAVSLHVAGPSGPMTWHAKALQTSYISGPGSGSYGADG